MSEQIRPTPSRLPSARGGESLIPQPSARELMEVDTVGVTPRTVRADAQARDRITRANARVHDWIGRVEASNARVAGMKARVEASNARVAAMNARLASMNARVASMNARVASAEAREQERIARIEAANDRFVRADWRTRELMIHNALTFRTMQRDLTVQAEASRLAAQAVMDRRAWGRAAGIVEPWKLARAAALGGPMLASDVGAAQVFREWLSRSTGSPPAPEPSSFRETETGLTVAEVAPSPELTDVRPNGIAVLPEEPADRAEQLLAAVNVVKAQMGDVVAALSEQRALHETEYAELRSLIEPHRPARLKRLSVWLLTLLATVSADSAIRQLPVPIIGKTASPPAEVRQVIITIKPTIILVRPPPRRRCGRPHPRRGCHRK